MRVKLVRLLPVCLLVAASLAHAGNMSCDQGSWSERLACKLVVGGTLVVGGVVVAADAAANAVSSRTEVPLRLQDGSIVSAKIGSSVLRGRRLVQGKPLELHCTVPEVSTDASWRFCDLRFPDLPPVPKSPDYYERIGKQPGYGFTIPSSGLPPSSVLVLEAPLKAEQLTPP